MAGNSKKKNNLKLSSSDIQDSKKPSMKTASDVISRLLWDESLPHEKFVVGYLDRFDGIVEKSFDSLDWRDPAIVDNHTLALPKHRIQYFKYITRKVWDKRTRLDIVFGSTGYPLSIHDFISRVDSNILDFKDEVVFPEIAEYSKAVSSLHKSDSSEDIASEDECDSTDRPNFFIAARIEAEETVSNLKEVSDYIKARDEFLGECCIPPEMLHMTFNILKLDSASDVCNAVEALKSVADRNLSPVTLNLEGLDTFKHRVLFARLEENDKLMELRNKLVEELVSRNVVITDRFSFVPHVTIAKLSRPVSRLRHSKYIDQYLYLKFEDNVFGTQIVKNLYLCEMGAARREDGFYKCAFEISLA
ncbi:hypothetical protein JTE90_001558 [Oedothorax gibbosus]|uniref:Leukocyte receptor cluster member 9 n=1 Tax=Oedothorax gibbosus TaxID=931172 RepID=A0AAV6VPI7_9ARAC|nr:hypothetical protein JTE90_001558 [Oedothorax gibbosus]